MKRMVLPTLILVCVALTLDAGNNVSAQGSTPSAGSRIVVVAPSGLQTKAISPQAPIGFALDDGIPENAASFGNSTYNVSFGAIWLNDFAVPNSAQYPLTLTGMQIAFPGANDCDCVGKAIRLLIYLDYDRDGNPANASLIYNQSTAISVADWTTFQYFPINNLTLYNRGDLYVGWEDQWADNGYVPREYSAAVDTTHPQHRSWSIAETYSYTPNIYNLAVNDSRHRLDDFDPGNLLVRLLGDTYSPATATPVPPTPTHTPVPTATPIPPRCTGGRFTDVCPPDYFYDPVNALVEAGIISGYNSSPPCINTLNVPCFLPYNNTTRGQMAKLVVLAANLPIDADGGPHFSDVPTSNAFYYYADMLVEQL
jgi:hypothetical protein